jgi:hypothetical protein
LKVTGAHSNIYTGDTLLAKAKRESAELANSYMPLLIRIVPGYPDIGSGKNWDQIQEHFRLTLWQELCKILMADNVEDAQKLLKDAQGRLNSFDEHTNRNPPKNQEEENAHACTMQELRKETEKLEAKLAKVMTLATWNRKSPSNSRQAWHDWNKGTGVELRREPNSGEVEGDTSTRKPFEVHIFPTLGCIPSMSSRTCFCF